VVDVEHGLHHVFIYAGDHAHGDGAPDTGRTGVFCITRCLNNINNISLNFFINVYIINYFSSA